MNTNNLWDQLRNWIILVLADEKNITILDSKRASALLHLSLDSCSRYEGLSWDCRPYAPVRLRSVRYRKAATISTAPCKLEILPNLKTLIGCM
ncbi:hypothetical protein MUK42_37699 [Musa troglodytarum]|uniref:Uncharacterized protein n=1 Tax=Musa troglodytarum TaxID=320322 RepID=A0A9E7KTP8_9LILI|nr:hypothetical protein MUK42_37699 [Musa troglodytarum]